MRNAPQIFHNKEDKPSSFVIYPTDLFAAINTIFNGNETKIILAMLGCKGDGSFAPSAAYIQKISGISKPNNYYRARKKLEDDGYIQTDNQGNVYIDTQQIIKQAKQKDAKTKG